MSHLLVLGGGWVGSAVARRGRTDPAVDRVSVVDPIDDPELVRRDSTSTEALRTRIHRDSITTVVNACGRVRGTDDELTDANSDFVLWLCDALQGANVRLVHVGSASEYGNPGSPTPVDESATARPAGAYAVTKAAGTDAVLAARERGLPATVARVFNIVGHPVPAVSPVHQWLTELSALPACGGRVEVWWPPTTRDFVMIEDAAAALVDLASMPTPPPPLVNVCSGTGIAFGEIVDALARSLGVPATIESLDRPGIEVVIGDPTLLHTTLGWVPRMSVEALAARATGADRGSGGPTGANR